jgi:hypothetical protein
MKSGGYLILVPMKLKKKIALLTRIVQGVNGEGGTKETAQRLVMKMK